MSSAQQKYDMEFVKGEYGENYTLRILNDDGTDADISSYTTIRLIIEDFNGVEQLNITSNLTISTPNVIWTMQNGQTNYSGKLRGQVILTKTGGARLVKVFSVYVHESLV